MSVSLLLLIVGEERLSEVVRCPSFASPSQSTRASRHPQGLQQRRSRQVVMPSFFQKIRRTSLPPSTVTAEPQQVQVAQGAAPGAEVAARRRHRSQIYASTDGPIPFPKRYSIGQPQDTGSFFTAMLTPQITPLQPSRRKNRFEERHLKRLGGTDIQGSQPKEQENSRSRR